MAGQQTTLGRFFSKESALEKVSTDSGSSSESDVEVLESHKESASASTSTMSETDSIRPSVHGCTCQCCSHPEAPYHPSDLSDSKICHEHHSKDRKKGEKKSYQRKILFVKYPWISVVRLLTEYSVQCVVVPESLAY